jgi:uncharacterized protein (TIGR03435 family)
MMANGKVALVTLVLVATACAQGAADRLTFEVASVKPAKHGNLSSMDGGPGTKDPGRFRATNMELSFIVMHAYGLSEDQLSRPAWMDRAEFDVVANVPPGTTKEQFRKMLQNLLAERFRMKVHHETRVVPIYELTVAKSGPKLKAAAQGSGTDDFVPGSGLRQVNRDGFPILPPGRSNFACQHLPDGSYCTYRMWTMERLAQRLSSPTQAGAGRRVVDKTALMGRYDFTLYFSPANGPDGDAPSIEQALQEQLGLKLVPSKASIDVLVIDHAETPTEN